MNSTLRKIFDGEYDITPKRDKEQQELCKQLCAEWDKVQGVFGDTFVDHLMELEGEQENWRAFCCYQKGFQLGIRLMLEALRD